MSEHPSGRRTVLRRILCSWYFPSAVGLLLVIALAFWIMPRRIDRTISADGLNGSTAQEMSTITEWDSSRLQAVAGVWWQALLLTLLFVGLAAALLYSRGWLFEKATAARFVAASLMIHVLLVFLMGVVPLARTIVQHAEEIRISEQAAQLFDDKPDPSPQDGQAAFTKVADPKSMEPTPLRPPEKRTTELPRMPERTETQVPQAPIPVARIATPDLQPVVPEREQPTLQPAPELPRRTGAQPPEPGDMPPVPVKPPAAEAGPELARLTGATVAQARQDPKVPSPPMLEMPRRGTHLPDRPAPIEVNPQAENPEVTVQAPRLPAEHRQPGRAAEPAQAKETVVIIAKAPPEPKALDPMAASVSLGRREDTGPPALVPPSPDAANRAGPGPLPVRPIVGSLPDRMSDAPPRVSSLPARLTRLPASGTRVARADDVDMAAYQLRQSDVRKEAINLLGGTKESEAAVERGLDWLAAHQNRNGSWSLQGFTANCKHPQCTAAATFASDTAGTGLALLPFLAAGYTHKTGKHQQTVDRAVKCLVDQQRADGGWLAPGDGRPMYGHGLAAIALCEAHGMTRDLQLRGPAQKALDFIARAQHAASGGWRYQPNTPGDTSVFGWQVMALKSGELAGLTVSPLALAGAKRWLKSVEANTPNGGLFGYQNPTPSPAMTAQGLLCMQLMGTRRGDPRLVAGADYLLKHLPQRNGDTSYYWYHATQVMYHMQGNYWKTWNERLRDMLVSTQITQGSMAGTWDPVDAREKTGGRICSTALRLLMLEVYYRHLPLYQQLEK